MPLRHRELCDLILYELYWMSADPAGPDDIAPHDFYQAVVENQTSLRFFDAAIERLGSDGYIDKAGVLPDTMTITNKGIEYVDAQLDNPDSFIWNEHQRRPPDDRRRIPAAGRFVELDHNSEPYKAAMNAGSELIATVRNNNRYAETESADRDQRLAELEGGYRLLHAPRVNSATVKIVLGGVLAYLAAKFADEPIGDLAKTAWSMLKKLLGIS